MHIRDAVAEDADAACLVMRRSIAELYVADHGNDKAILARWLGNKTPQIFLSWIAELDNSVLVAVEHGDILAVAAVTDAGDITLNYVSPDARFRGVSRDLLAALEARAGERGNTRCTLTSTETARRFYLANGYLEDGMAAGNFGTGSGYPMSRMLASGPSQTVWALPGCLTLSGLPCRSAVPVGRRADRRADCGRTYPPRATGFPPSRSGRWKP
jgi:GNAT superfamily N-acetyltransferase